MQKLLAISLLALMTATSVSGQSAISHSNVPALKFRHQVGQKYSSWFVDYLQYAGEPAFRIRVHHYHKWCNGYLFITPTRVAYVPLSTPATDDGIMMARRDVVATPRFAGYEFSLPTKTYAFAFLSDPDGAFVAGESEGREEFVNFVGLMLSDFAAAQRQFFAALAGSAAAANGKPSVGPAPVIKILNPSGAANHVTVDASATVQRVLGVAAAAGGIKAVTVNGAPATLTPLSPEIVQFLSSDLVLRTLGSNPVSVVATAGDNSVTEVGFNVTRPAVRILQPEVDGKISDPAVKIRGLVVGMHNLQRIDLAGKSLAVSKQDDGSFAFESGSLPVNLGVNYIPGFVVRADGERELYWATVWRVPPGPPPLSLDRIEGALRADVTNSRLTNLVNEYGVDFQLTPEIEKHLRSLGAHKALVDAIADSYK